jgi:Ni2+-binding GTPase involved in maturation of urease and hydrogenase
MSGSTKHVFPGGNTSKGFYSLYRYILSQDEARRIICIKGGPGTGKSSLMKNIARLFVDKGFDVEQHHCSSDNNSLDGVVIKGLNVAILDGTSPHVVDPINPGAVDEILNMGDCWNEEGFKKYRQNIIEINKEIGKTFRHAYRFLGSARCIHEDWSNCNQEALNMSKLNKFKESLKDSLFTKPVSHMGFDRHLFATAFTPNGIVTFVDNLLEGYQNVYVMNGGPGSGKTDVLQYISDEALKRGYFVEVFHDPFIPERIEHIFIPQLNFALVTSNEINQKQLTGKQINMEDFANNGALAKYRNQVEEDKIFFYDLTGKALSIISTAKKLHDDMEVFFIANMDFDKVNAKVAYVTEKFEKYAEEYNSNK